MCRRPTRGRIAAARTGALAALAALSLAAGPARAAEPVFFGKAELGATVQPVRVSVLGGPFVIEGHETGLRLECATSSGEGTVTGPATVSELRMHFGGCKVAGSAYPCEENPHETVLEGELGAITATLPGLRLHLPPGQGTSWMLEFCGGGGFDYAYWVREAAIAAISGASGETVQSGRLPASLKLALAQSGGLQRYTRFLSGATAQPILEYAVLEEEGRKYEFVGHAQPAGIAWTLTLSSSPAGRLGVTK